MFALIRAGALLLLALASPVLAVGLGPLLRSGITDGPGKAFFLDVSNSEPQVQNLVLTPLALDSELPAARVHVVPKSILLAPGGHRRVIVIARLLSPGESYSFRVCAERPVRPEETFHARVCSKLTARRIALRS